MSSLIQLEICAESVESARAAEQGGATRVEVCSGLGLGGITPSAGLIAMVRRNLKIPMHVLIRPRAGDFWYSADEFDVMQRDTLMARQLGANGVALGVLDKDGNVDVMRTRTLVEVAAPMQVTFHRAFDFARNPREAFRDVCETGATSILTSGAAPTAEQGSAVLRDLVLRAGTQITIVAAGKIRPPNVLALIRATGIQEIHANLAAPPVLPSLPPNSGLSLGTFPDSDQAPVRVSAEDVAVLLRAASEAL
jgi:copper homeostasis protein